MSSEQKNINRVRCLSFETPTLTCVARKRERERAVAGEGGAVFLGFMFYLFGASILRKLLLGFSL